MPTLQYIGRKSSVITYYDPNNCIIRPLYSYNEMYIFVNLHLAQWHMSDNKQRTCTEQFQLVTYRFESGSTVIRMVLSHLPVPKKYRHCICFFVHTVFM